MRKSLRALTGSLAVTGSLALAGTASAAVAHPAPAITHVTARATARVTHPLASQAISATTAISNLPDSGIQGNNWAYDSFTQIATIKLVGQVANGNCPVSDTGFCYLWDFTLADEGTSQTIAGQAAPRAGTLDLSLPVTMTGGTTNGQFYASWKTAKASRVPASFNAGDQAPTGRQTINNWVEQFFGSSADFNSAATPGAPDLGSKAGWTYTAGFGSDSQCSHEAYQWTDAAASGWGTLASDGNILANSSADCGTQG
jgi:hypothetical protein